MSEYFAKGFLIKKQDYGIFDEIITILCEDGHKLVCISLGSRKIESKNGRNLMLGNRVECEVFLARTSGKVSKLKKATALHEVPWALHSTDCFNLINECAEHCPNERKSFLFYSNSIETLESNCKPEEDALLVVLRNFCQLTGILFSTTNCVGCGSKRIRTISLKEHGLLCDACVKNLGAKIVPVEVSKLIYNLFKFNEITVDTDQANKKMAINLLKNFIDDNLGILLKSISNS